MKYISTIKITSNLYATKIAISYAGSLVIAVCAKLRSLRCLLLMSGIIDPMLTSKLYAVFYGTDSTF